MHDTKIQNKTYLGKYNHDKKLKIGDIQSMVFQPTDDVPWWLTVEQREEQRHD